MRASIRLCGHRQDILIRLGSELTSARGAARVNVFVQEDRVITPVNRQVTLLPPILLEAENAHTVHWALRHGYSGELLNQVIQSVRNGNVKMVAANLVDGFELACVPRMRCCVVRFVYSATVPNHTHWPHWQVISL